MHQKHYMHTAEIPVAFVGHANPQGQGANHTHGGLIWLQFDLKISSSKPEALAVCRLTNVRLVGFVDFFRTFMRKLEVLSVQFWRSQQIGVEDYIVLYKKGDLTLIHIVQEGWSSYDH